MEQNNKKNLYKAWVHDAAGGLKTVYVFARTGDAAYSMARTIGTIKSIWQDDENVIILHERDEATIETKTEAHVG